MKITSEIEQNWCNITRTISYDYLLETSNGGLPKFRNELRTRLNELEIEDLEDTLDKIIPYVEQNVYINNNGSTVYKLYISVTSLIDTACKMLTLDTYTYADDREDDYTCQFTSETGNVICGSIAEDDFGHKVERIKYHKGKCTHTGPSTSQPTFNHDNPFIVLISQKTLVQKNYSNAYESFHTKLCIYIPEVSAK